MKPKIKGAPPSYASLRLTNPAQEALKKTGNEARCTGDGTWTVTLTGTIPKGLVLVFIDATPQGLGLRMADEPPYPREFPEAVAWYERGEFVPCPSRGCGRALVWYEAGYVPGYRICTAGHHVQVSEDGRSAARVPHR